MGYKTQANGGGVNVTLPRRNPRSEALRFDHFLYKSQLESGPKWVRVLIIAALFGWFGVQSDCYLHGFGEVWGFDRFCSAYVFLQNTTSIWA